MLPLTFLLFYFFTTHTLISLQQEYAHIHTHTNMLTLTEKLTCSLTHVSMLTVTQMYFSPRQIYLHIEITRWYTHTFSCLHAHVHTHAHTFPHTVMLAGLVTYIDIYAFNVYTLTLYYVVHTCSSISSGTSVLTH